MNPFQMMIRSLVQQVERDQVDFVLHAGELGQLVIRQVVTGREQDFVKIRVADDRIFAFHLNVVSGFPLEVRPKSANSAVVSPRRIGFSLVTPEDDSTDM